MKTVTSLVVAVTLALAAGGAAPARAAGLFDEEAKLNAAADGKQYDTFGWSVAVSGNTAIAGAYSDDVGTPRPGAAYVFTRSGTTWTRQQKLTAGDAMNHDLFGASVGISGNTAIVGAWRSTSGFGAAYVFVRNGTAWTQQQKLDVPAHLAGDICGYAVAISGDTAVLTCENDSGVGGAYAFHRSGTTWTLQGTLQPVSSAAGDFFGFAVAIAGNTVLVGALGDKLGGAQPKGSATVYVRSGTTWSVQQKLVAPDGAPFDSFGKSVSLSGNTAVVGQVTTDDATNPLNQAAYVFARSGTTWTYQDKLRAGDAMKSDRFGDSVAVSGDTLLVGADEDDAGATPNTNEGSVYLFERTDGAWSPIGKLLASDQASGSTATGNAFGFSVALSGTIGIVGAPNFLIGSNFYQGQAYAFVDHDTDGDGLPDDWETNGVTIGGVFIDLPKMGANPRHKDLFVHADWMATDPAAPSVVFKPSARALRIVADAFAKAPVCNPDGKVGINIHIDAGPASIMNPKTRATWGTLSRAGQVPYQTPIGTLDATGKFSWTSIDTGIKSIHFDATKRAAAFHYAVFANAYIGGGSSSGLSRAIRASDFFVTLGKWPVRGGTVKQQAGTFMHELGHNLGLQHGGDDSVNNKPNYVSIMNYTFQTIGLLKSVKQQSFDYSAFLLPPLNETSLNEAVGIQHPLHYLTLWNRLSAPSTFAAPNYCVSHFDGYNRTLSNDALDWNCNGVKDAAPVAGDLNSDGDCVYPGPDTVADTGATGLLVDDDLRQGIVWTGANRTCDSTALNDDLQKRSVGYVEAGPILTSFKDWSHLDFGGGGILGASGAPSPPPDATVLYEPSMEEILDLSPASLQDEELVAPLDEVSLSVDEGPAPLVVDFDGSASTAVAGSIASWDWDFGDGTTGSGATPQHTYDTPGEYFASVTVTDSGGHVNLVPLLNLVTVTDGSVGPTPTATPTPAGPTTLDHFALYGTAASKGATKFQKLGPVALADGFGDGPYDLQNATGLALPANTNGGGFVDAAIDLAAYAVKPSKGAPKPAPRADVHVANACGETVVTTTKPSLLLIPGAASVNGPVSAPDENAHQVDHFLCWQAKPEKKTASGAAVAPFPKNVQVDVVNGFETKRFDLKKLVLLCNPTSKSGTPAFLSGPNKGGAVTLTPATVRHPETHLLCYQAALAKKRFEQNGCGPANPADKGTALAQAKFAPVAGVNVADQLGARQVDAKKESLLCLPSTLTGP